MYRQVCKDEKVLSSRRTNTKTPFADRLLVSDHVAIRLTNIQTVHVDFEVVKWYIYSVAINSNATNNLSPNKCAPRLGSTAE